MFKQYSPSLEFVRPSRLVYGAETGPEASVPPVEAGPKAPDQAVPAVPQEEAKKPVDTAKKEAKVVTEKEAQRMRDLQIKAQVEKVLISKHASPEALFAFRAAYDPRLSKDIYEYIVFNEEKGHIAWATDHNMLNEDLDYKGKTIQRGRFVYKMPTPEEIRDPSYWERVHSIMINGDKIEERKPIRKYVDLFNKSQVGHA
jgi:hypothetical protein